LFLDADVCASPETIAQVTAHFANDPEIDAIFGSYDGRTNVPGFVSHYKDLLHCYVHQHGRAQASTFWSGCGAIRKRVFLEHGGFDESYHRPAIEDIELGFRMVRAGRRIQLDRTLQVKHLKRWSFWSLLKNDMVCRGIPWTELILKSRFLPDDLNLERVQRLSVALMLLWMALLPATAIAGDARGFDPRLAGVALVPPGIVLVLNHRFYRFIAERRGIWFAAAAVPMHFLYHLNCGLSLLGGAIRYGWRSRRKATQPEIVPCPDPSSLPLT